MDHIQKLVEKEQGNIFDALLIPGDFCNVHGEDLYSQDSKIIDQFKSQMKEILNYLLQHLNIDKDKVFILPGNHDHDVMFKENEGFGCHNVHLKFE